MRKTNTRANKLNSKNNSRFSHLLRSAQDFNCHSGPVSCMRMSYDNGYLFTGGDDGSLCMFEVNDPEVSERALMKTRNIYTSHN